MTNPDELERAVERLELTVARYPREPRVRVEKDDLRLILSANREMRERLEPFAAIAGRYLTGGLKSDLDQRAPCLIARLKAEDFYAARSALTTQRGDGE